MVNDWTLDESTTGLTLEIRPERVTTRRQRRNALVAVALLMFLVVLSASEFRGEQFHVVMLFYGLCGALWAIVAYWDRRAVERIEIHDGRVTHQIRRMEGKRIGDFAADRVTRVLVWNFMWQGRIFLMSDSQRLLVFAYDLSRQDRREVGRRIATHLGVPIRCDESLRDAFRREPES